MIEPPPPAAIAAPGVLGAQEDAVEVDGQHRAPLLERHLHERARRVAMPAFGDHHVETAVALDGALHERCDLRLVAHVAGHALGVARAAAAAAPASPSMSASTTVAPASLERAGDREPDALGARR